MTREDIGRLDAFQEQTVIAVKAPEETKLEVPAPTEVTATEALRRSCSLHTSKCGLIAAADKMCFLLWRNSGCMFARVQDSIQVHLKAVKGPITVVACDVGEAGTSGCFVTLEESRIKTRALQRGTTGGGEPDGPPSPA